MEEYNIDSALLKGFFFLLALKLIELQPFM